MPYSCIDSQRRISEQLRTTAGAKRLISPIWLALIGPIIIYENELVENLHGLNEWKVNKIVILRIK